jgi:hypothetical protein
MARGPKSGVSLTAVPPALVLVGQTGDTWHTHC